MQNHIFVTKSSGEREQFSFDKLRDSLMLSGADMKLAEDIGSHIKSEIVGGMSTDDIYRHAFAVLRSKERRAAARYSLRRSLLELGPTGFPFEKFIAEVLKKKGYETRLNQMVLGKCIDHEMDVVAWNDEKLIMLEAKYHHELAYKSDVKVVLYIKARFDDLLQSEFDFGKKRGLTEGYLITNTKFTDKAIKYAECSGVKLIGWNYPNKSNLHDLIEETGLHPITCLTTLSDFQKKNLMEKGIVLCESFRTEKERILEMGIDAKMVEEAEAEAGVMCPA